MNDKSSPLRRWTHPGKSGDPIALPFHQMHVVDQEYLEVSYPRWMVEEFGKKLLQPGSVKKVNGGDGRKYHEIAVPADDDEFATFGGPQPNARDYGSSPDGYFELRAFTPGGGELFMDGHVSDGGVVKIEGSLGNPVDGRQAVTYGSTRDVEDGRSIPDNRAIGEDDGGAGSGPGDDLVCDKNGDASGRGGIKAKAPPRRNHWFTTLWNNWFVKLLLRLFWPMIAKKPTVRQDSRPIADIELD